MSNLDFIIAKIRGMRSGLYEGGRLSHLCDLASLDDLASTLAPDAPQGDVIHLQRRLTAAHAARLLGLLRFLDGWDAEMFLCLLRRYQVENLKVLLRCWAARGGKQALEANTVPLPKPLALPAAEMLGETTLAAALDHVPVRTLRKAALAQAADFERSGRLFFVEAGIDQAYYAELRRIAENAPASARENVMSLVLLEVGIYNVLLALRGLFNYSIAFDRLRPLMAPLGPHLHARTLEAMRDAPDLDTAAALVPPALLGERAPATSAERAELALWNHLARRADHAFYTSPLDFGAVVAFFYIKRVELANLIHVTEGLRRGDSPAAMRGRLIGLDRARLTRSA